MKTFCVVVVFQIVFGFRKDVLKNSETEVVLKNEPRPKF